jgi:amino acid transporter
MNQGSQTTVPLLRREQQDGTKTNVQADHHPHRSNKLKLLPLVFLIYFEVAGGPYGAERAVQAAGPLFTLLGFLVFPFAWGVPVSLVTAELAAAMPGNGGFVLWADRAFGPLAGSLLGTWKYLSCVVNVAAYPALVADYLGLAGAARTGAVADGVVGWGAVALGAVSLAPFAIMTAMALPKVEPGRWAVRGRNRDWRLFFNILFWNLNYWDSASTMAGEVERPDRTFPRAVAVVLIIASYLLPLMAATGATEAWVNGYFADAAGTCGTNCLVYCFRPYRIRRTIDGSNIAFITFSGKQKKFA